MKIVLCLFSLTIVAGCAGKIVTYDSKKTACVNGRCEGVPFYALVPHEEYYYQDRILDVDGKVTHFVGGKAGADCALVRVRETKLVPSSEPSLITYEARMFENSTFTVEYGPDGTLAKVGSESTPGAKAAAEALGTVVTAVEVLKSAGVLWQWRPPEAAFGSGIPLCSAGRVPAGTPKPVDPNKCGHPGQPLCTS